MDIGKARKKMHKRAKQLTKMHQMMHHGQDNSSSPDDRSLHHHQKSSESISSPSVHLKKKLTLGKTPKHHSPTKSHKETHPDHTEMDAFNGMIKEYNKQLVASQNPRDFHADLPIL
jgi:hypothetical protein